MAKKKKSKARRPDEAFSAGPITVSRFGKNTVWESHWPEGAFDEFQRELVERHPKVVEEIDSLVSEIASLVSLLPPSSLLHRAWWEMANSHIKLETEAQIDSEDTLNLRMIDYVQSVIAGFPPEHNKCQKVTEDDWRILREKVGKLFQKVNSDYQIGRAAMKRAANPALDTDFEEFHYKAQVYWCNVRGSRYQIHDPAYLQDMFLPHSAVLQELFGISGEEFVSELTKIWHVLSFGLQEVLESLAQLQKDTTDAVKKKVGNQSLSSERDLLALIAEMVHDNGWEDRDRDLRGRFLGMDLFDVEKTTMLPRRLVDELTWSQGDEKSFFAEGEMQGWPLRIWPVFLRPFVRLNRRSYCFDLYSLLDNIYRVMQRIILRLKPNYSEPWNRIQKELSEDLPFKYLGKVLPGARVFRQVYYRGRTTSGTTDWCETDGLLIYDDHLFVIEAKGGAFTYTPPATDFPAYIASLKSLIWKPATQGKRFLDYLNNDDVVPLFNREHCQIGELRKTDFRHITICAVTIDPFTEMAAQAQHLRKIGIDVGSEPVWALSVDDLRVYADIFDNPLLFLHYVEQRMRAFRSSIIQSDDELDHVGLYLKHNNYSQYAERLQGRSGAKLVFQGYRSDIDRFFTDRLFEPNASHPLRQKLPARIADIIRCLSVKSEPGRAEVSGYLLDLDGDSRELFAKNIDQELGSQPATKRAKPVSLHGTAALTVFCWTDRWAPPNSILALEHARAILLINHDVRRLLLELSYTDSGVLKDVMWCWVNLKNIPIRDLPSLEANADRLRATRILNAKAEKSKIGRNDECPCGSGKKYKKCCIGR